jgi:hypothetical protein
MNDIYIFFRNLLYFTMTYIIWTQGLFSNLNHKLLEYSGLTTESEITTPTETTTTTTTIKTIPFENKYLEIFENMENSHLSQEQIEELSNNYIMEYTPVGNVIMQYNHKKESFLYYSDNVIPFRYLEPIGRKYVIVFKCKQLFIDMKEELEKSKTQNNISTQPSKLTKTKDILSKLKSNSTLKPLQPQINAKIQINRYTSMGRFSNFNFLKQVDKTIVDKNYSISFSDFKKMSANKTSL